MKRVADLRHGVECDWCRSVCRLWTRQLPRFLKHRQAAVLESRLIRLTPAEAGARFGSAT